MSTSSRQSNQSPSVKAHKWKRARFAEEQKGGYLAGEQEMRSQVA